MNRADALEYATQQLIEEVAEHAAQRFQAASLSNASEWASVVLALRFAERLPRGYGYGDDVRP